MKLCLGSVGIKGTVAYMGQRPFIQNSTLRDNITFGESVIIVIIPGKGLIDCWIIGLFAVLSMTFKSLTSSVKCRVMLSAVI